MTQLIVFASFALSVSWTVAFHAPHQSYAHQLSQPPSTIDTTPVLVEAPTAHDNHDRIQSFLADLYGHDRVRRIHAARSKSNFLAANPNVPKRHMTYGELPLELFANTLSRMSKLVAFPGSFVDLGSGVGRLTLAAALLAPSSNTFTSTKGIEIVPDLHDVAVQAAARAEEILTQDDATVLPFTFHLGDAFDTSNGFMADASAVYCYSTTWECNADLVMPELSQSLAATLPADAIVAMTDRKLAAPFVLVDSITGANAEKGGPTATSDVYIYRLERPS